MDSLPETYPSLDPNGERGFLEASCQWEPNVEERSFSYHGGSHEKYGKQKKEKLERQLRPTTNGILSGCHIWIDGQTTPPASELRDVILENGGNVVNVMATDVTHIVCENLAANKMWHHQNVRKLHRKRVFVKPAWIVDSIKAGKLRDAARYAVIPPIVGQMLLQPPVHGVMTQSDKLPDTPSKIAHLDELPTPIRKDVVQGIQHRKEQEKRKLPPDLQDQQGKNKSRRKKNHPPRRQRPQPPLRELAVGEHPGLPYAPPGLSQVDHETFNAMSEDLRRRLLAAEGPLETRLDDAALPVFAPSTCSFEKVAKPLQNFMRRTTPSKAHAALVIELLAVHVLERRSLDDAAQILRLIIDLAETDAPKWKTMVDLITTHVQALVGDAFNGATLTLGVPRLDAIPTCHPDSYFFDR